MKRALLLLIALVVLAGCDGFHIGGFSRLDASLAPTAIPLAGSAASSGGEDDSDNPAPPQERLLHPPGFRVMVFAAGLDGPRMMAVGPDGHVYVAERGAGRIVRLPDRDGDGRADAVEVAADGLNSPSSLDFHPDGALYVGETPRVLRLEDAEGDGIYTLAEVVVDDLPPGGNHHTRTVLFGPGGEALFVSVGSSCNACREEDERRAAILRYNPDGIGETLFATGLRNAVGITFRPGTDELWATNNGRDWLGDNQPPETVYRVTPGQDYGWPECHAGRIVDPDFGGPDACEGVPDPVVETQAHGAPLGLAFYDGQAFPEDYHGDLFVALHGSWNRSVPTGYKVVRVPMADGAPAGPVVDFVSGWLQEGGSSWGRPVDVVVAPDGSLLISDDSGGTIYRVAYVGE